MRRQPVPRPMPGNDWAAFDADNAVHRAALLAADADALWQAGHYILALALNRCLEFKYLDVPITGAQAAEAYALAERLGIRD